MDKIRVKDTITLKCTWSNFAYQIKIVNNLEKLYIGIDQFNNYHNLYKCKFTNEGDKCYYDNQFTLIKDIN